MSVDAAQRSCEPLERVQDLWGAVSGAEEAQAKMHGMLAPLAAAAGRATSAGGGEDESLRALRDGVDEVMRSTEEALLVTRLLLRHAAELLAFVHHVDVPVHPSQHHKVGGKTRKLPQVCPRIMLRRHAQHAQHAWPAVT